MKLEDITVPDADSVPPEMWAKVGSMLVVLALVKLIWSRPVLRYGLIGAMILGGILFVAKQGGWV
jgi:hypothetical protein